MSGIVSTKQIYFRPINKQDIDNGWLSWINDPVGNKFLVHKKPTRYEDLVTYLENSQPPAVYMFAVCLVDNDEYIGNARLCDIDWINRKASYGRLIGSCELRGRGIGTEILLLLAHYAFYKLNLNRIYTGVNVSNIPSIKSNEKAGAVKEGVLRKDAYINGKYEDSIRFGMIKEDYDQFNWKEVIC